ncbi:hypothetical protein E2C01_035541 [Portunus trituberculatus]|uniref:Uncharacterized protein n=1 Tax=Portunus trituberculatus TaxID=210409 RepID=A0A5B7F3F7_PORTR|nr:hypothetical protein [Portunus trituberculatus]
MYVRPSGVGAGGGGQFLVFILHSSTSSSFSSSTSAFLHFPTSSCTITPHGTSKPASFPPISPFSTSTTTSLPSPRPTRQPAPPPAQGKAGHGTRPCQHGGGSAYLGCYCLFTLEAGAQSSCMDSPLPTTEETPLPQHASTAATPDKTTPTWNLRSTDKYKIARLRVPDLCRPPTPPTLVTPAQPTAKGVPGVGGYSLLTFSPSSASSSLFRIPPLPHVSPFVMPTI